MTIEDFDQLTIAEKIEACGSEGNYYQLYSDQDRDTELFLSLPFEDPDGIYFPMPGYVYRFNDFYAIECNGLHGRRFYTSKTDPFAVIRRDRRATDDRKFRKHIRTVMIVVSLLYVIIPLLFVYLGARQHVPSIKDYVLRSLQNLDTVLAIVLRFVIKWVYVGGFFLLFILPVGFLFKYIKEDVLGIHE